MKGEVTENKSDKSEHTSPMAVLDQISVELSFLKQQLDYFQNDLSSLLFQAHVSVEHIRKIQTLDRATQVLDDLSRVVMIFKDQHPSDPQWVISDLSKGIILGDLRHRFCNGSSDTSDQTSPETGSVKLF